MFVEVLVVGAGPAGSAVAAALACRGREVLLVDRARFPRPKPCGEYMSPACDALLAELGVAAGLRRRGLHPHRRLVLRAPDGFGLSVSLDQLIAHRSPVKAAGAAGFFSPRRHGGVNLSPQPPPRNGEGEPGSVDGPMEIRHPSPFQGTGAERSRGDARGGGEVNRQPCSPCLRGEKSVLPESPSAVIGEVPEGPTAFALSRAVFDHALLEHAAACGARVWEGVQVRQPLFQGEQVVGVEATREGAPHTIRARLVIAADGARSMLARRLGLARPVFRHRKFGLVARYGDVGHAEPDAVEMHVCPPGYCGFALEADGEANLGMVVDAAEAARIGGDPTGYFEATLPRFSGIAGQLRGARRLGKVATVGPIAAVTARQSGAGVLLIGDAAGFYDPFTGQGITFALETARLAAAVADAALAEGDLSARHLAAYDRARTALLGPKLSVHRVIQAIMARPAWFGAALRRLDARPALARQLIGVTADLYPPETVWSWRYVARLARP